MFQLRFAKLTKALSVQDMSPSHTVTCHKEVCECLLCVCPYFCLQSHLFVCIFKRRRFIIECSEVRQSFCLSVSKMDCCVSVSVSFKASGYLSAYVSAWGKISETIWPFFSPFFFDTVFIFCPETVCPTVPVLSPN